ncbi:hypothetical protein [Sedimentitalea arenosa]|jgi:hypothetical protein|uniref:Uncharacterized protein n=1 Tax=Sedimentitalea arenosa TaxID=2798803 RepID=A0A8J7M025_9RHOB|nr:hypothetical protein [Arenibacterium arenosum]MBJ6373571.1 hypothetical protein [Arenibacterium arenosum]
MDRWHFTMNRWPDQAFSIRRRMKDDERFCEIVCDYEVARSALQHWRLKDPPETQRITDYKQIVRELEAEIEADLALSRLMTSTGCGGES